VPKMILLRAYCYNAVEVEGPWQCALVKLRKGRGTVLTMVKLGHVFDAIFGYTVFEA